jgi:hypothetical protein
MAVGFVLSRPPRIVLTALILVPLIAGCQPGRRERSGERRSDARDDICQGKILAEAIDAGERATVGK